MTDGCNGAISLGVGDSATCWVMFEVAATATLSSVPYHALHDTFVKAPITIEPKGVMRCEARTTSSLHCGTCELAKCKAEHDAYLAAEKKCTNLNASSCGAAPYCDCACEKLLDQSLCPPIWDAVELCVGTKCLMECGSTQ